MKKILVVSIIAIFGLSYSAKAQNVDFGVKAGLNISNLSGGEPDRNNLLSLHFGGFTEFKLNEKFSIQPELLYSMQGSEVENSLKVRLDYLSIPLLAKYFVTKKFSIEAGPQLSFLMKDKVEILSSGDEVETDASSFDFGLSFGFAYDLSPKIFIQTRYNYGITTVSENPDIKNSVFQLSLGYKL